MIGGDGEVKAPQQKQPGFLETPHNGQGLSLYASLAGLSGSKVAAAAQC